MLLKPKKIVFRRPRLRSVDIKPYFSDIVMVNEVKLLGIIFTSKLTFHKYVNDVLSVCNQRFYLLKLLRNQGMPLDALDTVYHALVVNRIGYCLSAWGGFLITYGENRINVLFKRAKRYGFTDTIYNVVGLRENADQTLFKCIQVANHCLNSILPPVRSSLFESRSRGHDFCLPTCITDAYRKSYLPRCLFSFV